MLSPLEITLLLLGAALVGLSKTAVPGAGTLSVAIFAAVLPAKESTGALLVLLILGDLFAVWTYHAHADWRVLRRMVPTVLAGIAAGTVFLALADDAVVRRVIGVILLLLVAVTVLRRRASRSSRTGPATLPGDAAPVVAGAGEAAGGRRAESATYGVLAGFTTMVANAGGPVMSMYLLAARFPVHRFLGTAAWFFLAVNLAKVPFSVSLGLIDAQSLRWDLVLAPAVVVGALAGRRLAPRIPQALFDRLVLGLTVLSAGYLVL